MRTCLGIYIKKLRLSSQKRLSIESCLFIYILRTKYQSRSLSNLGNCLLMVGSKGQVPRV